MEMFPIFIALGVVMLLSIIMIVMYAHYIRTEKIKQLSGTETGLSVAVEANQLDTLTWDASVYRHNTDFIKSEHDEELDTNVPYYLMMEDIHKHMEKLKFKKVRSSTEQYDDANEIWAGELFRTHVSVRLQYSCTHESFVDWEPQKDKGYYLCNIQVVNPSPEACAEALLSKFQTDYRRAHREKQQVSESTSVYEFVVNPFDSTYNLRRRSTQMLFKYGRVFSECAEMFKHIQWEFDGEVQEGFDGKEVADLISYCARRSPRVNGGILFGKPGTGKTSFLNALAFMLGKSSELKVIMVSGPTMADPVKMTALATRLADEKEKGTNPVIMINEGDSLMRIDQNGKKTPISEILMNLMDLYPCYISCNCEKDEIHEAFYREGRGSFLFYVGNMNQDQLVPVNAYIKKVAEEEESLVFIHKQFNPTPTLAQLFSQLKPAGWEEFKAKLKGNFAVKAVSEAVAEVPSLEIGYQQHQVGKNNLQKFRNRNKGKF
jgi:hypothetical protein